MTAELRWVVVEGFVFPKAVEFAVADQTLSLNIKDPNSGAR